MATKMSSRDIVDLHNDGFVGSNDELRISQEVFYGNFADNYSKICADTGVVITAGEENKMVDISLCSNSESSAVTNQASPKDLCLIGGDTMDFRRDFGEQSSMEGSIVGARIEHNLHAKRIKLSVKALSNFKPYLDTAVASSIPVKHVVAGMYDPVLHPCCQILMCHVVESSGESVTSSCYLLNQYPGTDREGNLVDGSTTIVSLSGSDGSIVKQFGGSKSIASPISQESSATKLLVSTPLAAMVKYCSLLKFAERRPKREISDGDFLLTSDSVKDSRALLRSRVSYLLKLAGWSTEKRKRGCGKYRYIYRSPEGKLFREFRRVWNIFGQQIFGQCHYQVAFDDKHWTDVGHFWSDLYDTLRYIENEMSDWEPKQSLARQWTLLNPFVTLVLIDRKIHALRAGNLCKPKDRDIVDVSSKAEVKFTKSYDKRSVNKHSGEIVHHSSLASHTAVIDGSRQSKQDALEAYKSRSIYVSEGNSMRLVKTIDGIENQSLGTCTDEIVHNSNHLQGCVSESTSLQFPICLYDVPVGNASTNMIEGLSEAFSHNHNHDSYMSFHGYNNQNLKANKENAKDQGNVLQINDSSSQLNLAEIQAQSIDNAESDKRFNNYSIQSQYVKKNIRHSKRDVGRKRSMACQLKDDDLLISAIIKKRSFKCSKIQCSEESGKFKLKPLKRRKSQKGSCRLLPRSLGKGSKHFKERWSLMCERTVLSWLISAGAVFINEPVQYRDLKDDAVVKDGHITGHGILCKCCDDVFSVSGFKIHAGFKQNRPCLNLFMGSDRPYTLCQLQAWSAEYKARRSGTRSIPADEFDTNDDSCGLCGDGGELLCCDNCPSTFHQSCLSAEELPEGSWYCGSCTCRLCGDLVNDKETSGSNVGLKCSHCAKKYHEVCLMDKAMVRVAGSPWFCGIGCEEVYCGLQSRVGLCNPIADGYSWTLLKCIHDDQRIPSPQHFALKAECNSKLAVAVTIMEECFLSMTDPRTGIDMIPQVVYNWGSEFPRLDYHSFYTAVLEMDDVLISVACIRLHGIALAEMPLIATCSKYRRQGMCRRLLDAIEKMLISLKVESLVIAAIPELVETWTAGFGFILMEDDEKRSLRKSNLMVFPGTVMLKKKLYVNQPTALQQGVENLLLLDNDKSFKMKLCLKGEPNVGVVGAQKSSEVHAPMESELLNTSSSPECKDKDTNITASASEFELGCLKSLAIKDHENVLDVAEDAESVEAARHMEVQSLQENSDGKCKTVTRDKPESTDQNNRLLCLFTKVCLDEVVSVPRERDAEVPFSVSSQVENGISEPDVASGLGSFVLAQLGKVESGSESNNPSNNTRSMLVIQ